MNTPIMRPNPDTGAERPEFYDCQNCGNGFLGSYDQPCPKCGSGDTNLSPEELEPEHEDVVDERDEAGNWSDRN